MKIDLEQALASARKASQMACNLLLSGFRSHPDVEHKGATDLVTIFDRQSEAILRRHLEAETRLPVVGEETYGKESLDEGTFWCVDPIDGTTNFVHGHPFFSVSIGLVRNGVPLLGLVVAPALGIEWAGYEGGIVTRNASPCRVSTTGDFGRSLLGTGFPYDIRESRGNLDAFARIHLECQAIRRCGSAAMDLALVADGTYDGYWEQQLKPWDFAAGEALVRLAGGRTSTYDGSAVRLSSTTMIATNGLLHDELLRRIDETSATES